jgi:hypothetical protein
MSPNAEGGENLRGLSKWVQLYTHCKKSWRKTPPAWQDVTDSLVRGTENFFFMKIELIRPVQTMKTEYFEISGIFLRLIWRVLTIMMEYFKISGIFRRFLISREGVFRQFSVSFPTINENSSNTKARSFVLQGGKAIYDSTTAPHSLCALINFFTSAFLRQNCDKLRHNYIFLRQYCVILRQYCVKLRQYCVFFRQYCVNLRQYCDFLRQYCIFLPQYSVFQRHYSIHLRQYCIFLRQYCVILRQYCVKLRQYCVFLRQYCVNRGQ